MTLPRLNLDFKGQNSHFVIIFNFFLSKLTKFDLRDQFLTSKFDFESRIQI